MHAHTPESYQQGIAGHIVVKQDDTAIHTYDTSYTQFLKQKQAVEVRIVHPTRSNKETCRNRSTGKGRLLASIVISIVDTSTPTRFTRLATAGAADRSALQVALSAALSKSQAIRLALAATLQAPLTPQQPLRTAFLVNSEQHACTSSTTLSALS